MLYDTGAGEDFSRRGEGGGLVHTTCTLGMHYQGADHKMLPFDNGNLQCFKTFTTEMLAIP